MLTPAGARALSQRGPASPPSLSRHRRPRGWGFGSRCGGEEKRRRGPGAEPLAGPSSQEMRRIKGKKTRKNPSVKHRKERDAGGPAGRNKTRDVTRAGGTDRGGGSAFQHRNLKGREEAPPKSFRSTKEAGFWREAGAGGAASPGGGWGRPAAGGGWSGGRGAPPGQAPGPARGGAAAAAQRPEPRPQAPPAAQDPRKARRAPRRRLQVLSGRRAAPFRRAGTAARPGRGRRGLCREK